MTKQITSESLTEIIERGRKEKIDAAGRAMSKLERRALRLGMKALLSR